MSARPLLVGLAVLSALSGGTVVAAAAPPSAPRHESAATKPPAELVKSGEKKFDAGQYAEALVDFEAADAQQPTPELARFIGRCEDKLGHFHLAVRAYERFLAAPPAKLVGEVGGIVKRVDEIKAMPANVRIETVPSGATVTVDGAVQSTPSPVEVTLPPGKHLIRVVAPSYDALEREVDTTFASTKDVSMELTAAPPPPKPVAPPPIEPVVAPVAPPPAPPTAPRPPRVSRRSVALAAAGVAVVGAGVATVFGILALDNKSSYKKNPTFSNSDNGNNDAAYADGGIALAVAAGVTSLVLFLTSDPGTATNESTAAAPKPSTAFSAAPFVTPHGAGAGAILRF